MKKYFPHWDFMLMALFFKFRDLLISPNKKLADTGLKSGFHVLDYGCGPGSFSIAAALLVGPQGKVYTVDINPLALRMVRKTSLKKGLKNIETIQTERDTGLESNCVDAVLLFDTFHDLSDPGGVLMELYRVLKPSGILVFSDHHIAETEILRGVTESGLFRLDRKGIRSYRFLKLPAT